MMQCKKSSIHYLPLVDKYKPKKIDDIMLSPLLRSKIKSIIDTKYISSTIFVGPSGVGKTLLIKLLAKYILGDSYVEGVLDLNTSSQRGLINLNTSLPQFCQKQITKLQAAGISKIVLMDEADNITKKAQNLISNMLEHYTDTIFIFTCNDSSKLIESIQSRCSILYFPILNIEDVCSKMVYICEHESLPYTEEGISMIAKCCKGDMRASINLLDAVFNGFPMVKVDYVKQMLYRPDSFKMIDLIRNCAEKNINKCFVLINDFKKKGFCGTDILLAMIDTLKRVDIEEEIRITYIDIISGYFTRISDGLDTNLQLYGCVSMMILS